MYSLQFTIYYRLEVVDKDGSKTYSVIKTLNLKPQTLNSLNIFPNPAKDFITIECADAQEIIIVDYLGKEVYTKKIFNNQYSKINIQQFVTGNYVVKVVLATGKIEISKFIKH